MTDSDLVSEVKRNLFNTGKQNTANIMEAMLRRLVRALLGEKRRLNPEFFICLFDSWVPQSQMQESKS